MYIIILLIIYLIYLLNNLNNDNFINDPIAKIVYLHNDPDFIVVYNLLDTKIFNEIKQESIELFPLMPLNTPILTYEHLHNTKLKNILLNHIFLNKIKGIIGCTNLYIQSNKDPYTAILRCLTEENDSLEWHYDTNYIPNTRMYVLLLTLYNEGTNNNMSHQRNCRKINDKSTCIDTPENSLFIYEGTRILHGTTPLKKNEKRFVLQTSIFVN